MDFSNWFTPEVYTFVILPLFVFFARVFDVSLGTIRIIFVSRGKRNLAPILGFIEVFIWIVAVSALVRNLSSLPGFLAYAAGFAVGNYIGMLIEDKLALGMLSVRIITVKEARALVERLHDAGYGVTAIDGKGATGNVKVIYTIIKRKDLPDVVNVITSLNPKAFFSVEEVRTAKEGIFPPGRGPYGYRNYLKLFTRGLRK
jgi:uncharacterized protein YebE (UPF0316 family)